MTVVDASLNAMVWDNFLSHFIPIEPDPYLTNPAGWVSDQLGEHLWSKRRDMAQSVVDHRRTAVKSCHDAGKSFIASRLAAWWIAAHQPGEAFVVSTAPTYQQVHAILWEEIRAAAKKANIAGNPSPAGCCNPTSGNSTTAHSSAGVASRRIRTSTASRESTAHTYW